MPEAHANCLEADHFRYDPPHRRAAEPEPLAPPSWYGAAKRVADVAGALSLIVLTAPLLAVVALVVKLTSRGPAIYSQLRVGLGGRLYTLYKVRSMYHNCEGSGGPKWATKNDPRVTRVGRVLRKTHLDELPQLWNVLAGHMSLIGPRPERPEFVAKLENVVPLYRERLRVRPGITGLAQVQLPPDTDLGSVRRKVAYDVYYIRYLGLWMDVRVAFGTARYVLRNYFGGLWDLFDVPGGRPVEGHYERLVGYAVLSAPHDVSRHGRHDTLCDVEILRDTPADGLEVRGADAKAH